jgi:hypothetical protein
MPIAKTDKGRQALTQRAEHALSQRERQLLILANGKQSRAELVDLLGAEADALIGRLIERGYLIDLAGGRARGAAGAEPEPGWLSATGTFRRSAGESVRARAAEPAAAAADASRPVASPAPAAAPVPAAVAPRPARDARRSIAATKMYVVDILQLMRDPEASSLAVDLQTSRDDLMLMQAVVQALRYVEQRGAGSLAVRMRQRLGEIVPSEHLPLLDGVGEIDTIIG